MARCAGSAACSAQMKNSDDHCKALALMLHKVAGSVGLLLSKQERLDLQNEITEALVRFWSDNPECCPYPNLVFQSKDLEE
jgi:hypothetical protein